jgi:adenine-specific DNA-methyltransferase
VWGQRGMSRLTELIGQVRDRDPSLGAELEREYRTLSSRRAFGLNFERHRPEAVELPGRPIRRGDKVRILPPRGSTDRGERRLWRVARIEKVNGERIGHLQPLDDEADGEQRTAATDDLVVVAEFRDPIHPGLVPTGRVQRGGDKPAHTVINGENFHVLKALTYTHRGKMDAIYIDPPYNTGAKDWKYNNDYVEGDDLYRHSKWLAFMERRLLLAKELLDPELSVLIVTIDEKEYLRLGLLLEQVFPEARIQMVSSVTNPKGVVRAGDFARVNEYLFFVLLGAAEVGRQPPRWAADYEHDQRQAVPWQSLRRSDIDSARHGPTYRPRQFYPIYVNTRTGVIEDIGEPIPKELDRSAVPAKPGTDTVFPVRPDGTEIVWGVTDETLRRLHAEGFVSSGNRTPDKPQTWSIKYLTSGRASDIREGRAEVVGRNPDGSVIAEYLSDRAKMPPNQWHHSSHNAQHYGTLVNQALIPGRRFPFPKALYAVEDCLGLVVGDRPDAIVLDYFAGSGTTAHAVMRLNKQDGGRRQCISVTNNEVSADEQRRLRQSGSRPGDPQWETLGICEHITKPRIEAAITGRTPDGEPIRGDYKFTEEFSMADGFEQNAEFFTLTYESPVAISHNRAFERVAPLLWLRAGAEGRRIDRVPEEGWEVADTYGILWDLDQAGDFLHAVEKADRMRMAYVVTDDDRRFQSVARQLSDGVDVVRLYESYLSNFRFTGVEP